MGRCSASRSGQQVYISQYGRLWSAAVDAQGDIFWVAVDRDGNIDVENRGGPRVVKLSPVGVPVAEWKTPVGYVPGMDARGNLYLTLNTETGPCMLVTLSPDLQVRSHWL